MGSRCSDLVTDYHARLIERLTRRKGGRPDYWRTRALVQLLNDEFQRLRLAIEEAEAENGKGKR